MGYQTLEVVERAGAVWVALNRPEALNSIDEQVTLDLLDALKDAFTQGPVAVVLKGKGRAFCTGADLKWAKEAFAGDLDNRTRRWLLQLGEVMNLLEEAPVPTIAAVNGICVAGGCELVPPRGMRGVRRGPIDPIATTRSCRGDTCVALL